MKASDKSSVRQHKSNRAATYFNALSAGVKAVGSFDSVSDRFSSSTSSKKRGRSSDSQTKTLNSDSGTLDTVSASRSRDDETRSTLPSTDRGFRARIFRNAKSHIVRMGKNGDISKPFKARVLRVMDPLVGKSSSDDESSVRDHEEEEAVASPNKGYLPACHFFCG